MHFVRTIFHCSVSRGSWTWGGMAAAVRWAAIAGLAIAGAIGCAGAEDGAAGEAPEAAAPGTEALATAEGPATIAPQPIAALKLCDCSKAVYELKPLDPSGGGCCFGVAVYNPCVHNIARGVLLVAGSPAHIVQASAASGYAVSWTGGKAKWKSATGSLPAGWSIVGKVCFTVGGLGTPSVAMTLLGPKGHRLCPHKMPLECKAGPKGACCLPHGKCKAVTQSLCELLGGNFHAGASCTDPGVCNVPPPFLGACCMSSGTCTMSTPWHCGMAGGTYHPGALCSPDICCPPGACCGPAGCTESNACKCQPPNTFFPGQKCSDVVDQCCGDPTLGSCCLPEMATTAATCVDAVNACKCAAMGGTFHPGGTCKDTWCCNADVLGACCSLKGCFETSECQCPPNVGKFYPGKTCADIAPLCCKPIYCKPGTKPVDTDGDGCPDTCLCMDAYTCADFCKGGTTAPCDPKDPSCGVDALVCQCPDGTGACVLCPDGTHAVDFDGDGCPDVCDCCPPPPVCKPGMIPVDTDGDGCLDDCKCEVAVLGACCTPFGCFETTQCECKGKFLPGLTCKDAMAEGLCCPPPPLCPVGQKAVDTDGDGCLDTCVCREARTCADYCKGGTTAPCKPGSPACEANALVCQCPDGTGVCLLCPKGTHAVDFNGDGCPDVCDCCPKPPVCGPGEKPVDTDGDGCLDACICTQGTTCIEEGCKPAPCDPTIGGASCGGPQWLNCICPGGGVCLLCPDGTHAVDFDGDGCPDACDCCPPMPVCAPGFVPVDTDKDGCPDTCQCDTSLVGACCTPNGCFEMPQCECKGEFHLGMTCTEAHAQGLCCPEPPLCAPDEKPVDTDGDGCLDACICKAGTTCIEEGCKPAPCDPTGGAASCGGPQWLNCICPGGGVCLLCPDGTHAVDFDGDGCPDACDCCPVMPLCAPGFIPVDTDGDGCPDTCECDTSLVGACCTPNGCFEMPQCECKGEFHLGLTCQDANAKGLCCPEPPLCAPDEKPVDTDGDGCLDACICTQGTTCIEEGCKPAPCDLTAGGPASCGGPQWLNCICPGGGICLLCPDGTHAVDFDGDGCPDACDCCPPMPVCAPGFVPVDTDGDGCPDTCECDTSLVGACCTPNGCFEMPQCECKGEFHLGLTCQDANAKGLCCPEPPVCAPDEKPVDTDGDGCLDACICTQGTTCIEEGCKPAPCDPAAGTSCGGPQWLNCICPGGGICLLCPAGTKAVDFNGDGCPDACDCCKLIDCPAGMIPVDVDADGCPDTCACSNEGTCEALVGPGCVPDCGGQPIPGATGLCCMCPDGLGLCPLCPPGTHAVDIDGDLCPDLCDCCPPIKCPVGSAAVDTDKDGCPDTCLAVPLPQ